MELDRKGKVRRMGGAKRGKAWGIELETELNNLNNR